jgi:hypothetical protein
MSARLSIGRLHHRAHDAVRDVCARLPCGRPVKPIHDPLKSLPFHGRRLRRRSDALTRDFALFFIVQACSPGIAKPRLLSLARLLLHVRIRAAASLQAPAAKVSCRGESGLLICAQELLSLTQAVL